MSNLVLELRPGEVMVINGAPIRFRMKTRIELTSHARFLFGKQLMPPDEVAEIDCPTLVAVGTLDDIAGSPQALAALLPRGRALSLEGRDHNRAVGDRAFKEAVLAFLAERP